VPKTIPLAEFLRTFNLKDGEVLSVARSMDEDDVRVEVLQYGRVNGMQKDFVVQLDFNKAKSPELPWKGLKISRCMMSASANNECTFLHGTSNSKIAYATASATVEEGYESTFSVFR
jgi:hypothetical protein